jgi:sec-independent protein translocase protein TatA
MAKSGWAIDPGPLHSSRTAIQQPAMFTLFPSLAILDVGGTEIMMIMLVILLLFGSKRMPELARSLGKSIREFKKAAGSLEEELKRALETPPPPPQPRRPAAPAETDLSPKNPTQPPSSEPAQPPEENPYS